MRGTKMPSESQSREGERERATKTEPQRKKGSSVFRRIPLSSSLVDVVAHLLNTVKSPQHHTIRYDHSSVSFSYFFFIVFFFLLFKSPVSVLLVFSRELRYEAFMQAYSHVSENLNTIYKVTAVVSVYVTSTADAVFSRFPRPSLAQFQRYRVIYCCSRQSCRAPLLAFSS